MLRIATSILYRFSSRYQNFFEINPIYPEAGEKDFEIYNSQKKTIPVLEEYKKIASREKKIQKGIKTHLYLQKKTTKSNFKPKIDKQSGFMLTENEQLNAYIQDFQKNKKLGANIKRQFESALEKLIARFKVKSEAQLLRLLRINLVKGQTKQIKQQIRCKVIQQAILATGKFEQPAIKQALSGMISNEQQNKKLNDEGKDKNCSQQTIQIQIPVGNNQNRNSGKQTIKIKISAADNEKIEKAYEKLFKKALDQIDKKIQEVQKNLRYNSKGVKNRLDTFNVHYGWKPVEDKIINKDASLITTRQSTEIVILDTVPKADDLQNWSIKRRIGKLYFLERDKYLKQSQQVKVNMQGQFFGDNEIQKIVNDLAYRYKEDELLMEPDLQQIYRDIDEDINQIGIKIANTNQKQDHQVKGRHIIDQTVLRKEDLIWKNLQVDQVFAPVQLSFPKLHQKQLTNLSPNYNAQISINRVPFNLYRHSQFQVFGIFNKYRNFILQNVLYDQSVDANYQFKQYNLQQAKAKLSQQSYKIGTLLKITGCARRKSSRARVLLTKGIGKITINGQQLYQYFPDTFHRVQSLKPLLFTQSAGKFDLKITVVGGGLIGKSECIAYAIAKALIKLNVKYKPTLNYYGLVGSDLRKKEVKRMGLYSARKRPPFVRR